MTRRANEPAIAAGEAARSLEILIAVSDMGSFTAAAERLGLTPSAVSKAVARAEARLGVQLVKRTTRSVAFTDDGASYVARGRGILDEMKQLDREATSRDGAIRGTLRVAAPSVYGAIQVAPRLAALQRKHPAVEIRLLCDDRVVDIVAERIDIAVRILATPPAEFVARAVADDRRGLYASPSYLRRARTPRSLEDLVTHAAVTYSGEPVPLARAKRGRVVFATDSVLAAREAALAGVGIAALPEYLASDDVAADRLREVLPGSVVATRKIYVIYLASPFMPAHVRTAIGALTLGC